PNGWGLYDVLGNLGEWLYDGGYSHRPEGPHTDPIIRVARLAGRAGGFYSMDAVLHRAANRMSGFLDNARRFPSYGFRLARTDHSSAGAGGANPVEASCPSTEPVPSSACERAGMRCSYGASSEDFL